MLEPNILIAAQAIWDYHHIGHVIKPCDIMLVLGSYDLRVADHAASLYQQNLALQVIISGGIAHTDDLLTTGWNKPEADIFAERMIEHGVPADKILRETAATNTGQNYSLAKQVLDTAGLTFGSALVVTKPVMERRAIATADIQWPDKDVVITSPPITMQDYFIGSLKDAAIEIAIMVGDMQRLQTYPEKGFMSQQVIPENVLSSYKYLVQNGFDGNLV